MDGRNSVVPYALNGLSERWSEVSDMKFGQSQDIMQLSNVRRDSLGVWPSKRIGGTGMGGSGERNTDVRALRERSSSIGAGVINKDDRSPTSSSGPDRVSSWI
jgi:hypothetical protein